MTIIAAETRAGAIAISYHLLQSASNDEAAERNDIGYLRTKWVKITTEPPQKVVLDGEIIGTTPIEVKCIPQGLTVFTPMEQVVQAEEKLDHLTGIKIIPKESIAEEQTELDSKKLTVENRVEINSKKFIDKNN